MVLWYSTLEAEMLSAREGWAGLLLSLLWLNMASFVKYRNRRIERHDFIKLIKNSFIDCFNTTNFNGLRLNQINDKEFIAMENFIKWI